MKKRHFDIGIFLYLLLCALLLAIACSGCKSTKEVAVKANTKQDIRCDSSVLFFEQSGNSVYDNIVINTDWLNKLNSETNVKRTEKEYSPPDSIGNQYMLKETTTDYSNKTQKEEKSDTDYSKELTAITSEITEVKLQLQTLKKDIASHKIDEQHEMITWHQSALLFLGFLFLVYILFKVFLKKKCP